MKKNFALKALGLCLASLLFAGCTAEDSEPLVTIDSVNETDALTLRIEAPNDIVLRAASSTIDPLTEVRLLRLVFYRSVDEIYRVAYIREVTIGDNTDLSNMHVKLPRGDYQLVAIANPTPILIELTMVNRALTELTEASPQTASHLRLVSASTPKLLIPMLNAQGAIDIPSSAFDSSDPATSIQLEPTLARVLVFGTPEVHRGNQGTAPLRYTTTNLTSHMSYLRMLNRLEEGVQETLNDGSNRKSRYASCDLWSSWESQTPTSTRGVAHMTESLYKKQEYWSEVQPTPEAFSTHLSSPALYCKEGVLPPKAYLQGLVPTVVVAFPYIPEGLTLSDEEGWIEYRGRVYSESRVRTMIQTKKYDTPEFEAAIKRANITNASFSEGFSKENINFYHKGVNYYGVPIRHFASATAPTAYGRYGVVRGNEYRIKLVRVTQMGTPTPMVYTDNLNPIDENEALTHSLVVVPIERREQDAEL